MGSLENALLLARTVGETVTKVQGPMEACPMTDALIRPRFTELHKQGPVDQWWQGVAVLYDDCMKGIPKDCRTLAEYAQWAEHMVRFWHTLLSAREIVVAWAGRDAASQETKISPSHNLVKVRDLQQGTDFPKGQTSMIETIGNETIAAMKQRGIDCFDPWTSTKYRVHFSVASANKQAKVLCHQGDTSLLCGFYSWLKRAPQPRLSAMPTDRTIGKETLCTRTLWSEEIALERVGFRRASSNSSSSLTSINEDEAALRLALDLMKISMDTKLPLVLPEPKKATP